MPKPDAQVYLALLRGVNLGGKTKLPMKDLAEMFGKAGCAQVKTYIQSGNVVFTAPQSVCDGLSTTITKQIEKRFGHRPPIMLRTLGQMAEVVGNNPYLKSGADETRLHVLFLANKPSARAVAALDPNRSPGDEYAVRGQEIYLRLQHGFAKSKLTNAYFDSKLGTVTTARNWRTTVALLEMMTGLPAAPAC